MIWLADTPETPDPSNVSAGWTGLVVLLLLAVATVFLVRSMNKRLKGIDFDENQPGRDPDDPAGPAER
jgi:hypothetical protein